MPAYRRAYMGYHRPVMADWRRSIVYTLDIMRGPLWQCPDKSLSAPSAHGGRATRRPQRARPYWTAANRRAVLAPALEMKFDRLPNADLCLCRRAAGCQAAGQGEELLSAGCQIAASGHRGLFLGECVSFTSVEVMRGSSASPTVFRFNAQGDRVAAVT